MEGDARRPSLQSEKLDDVEYTKDEELERLKGFWHRLFHRHGHKKDKSSRRGAVA